MDDYSVITATITDKFGNVETAYVATIPTWSLEAGLPAKDWRKAYRKYLLDDRTTDQQGWRVVFAATPEQVAA